MDKEKQSLEERIIHIRDSVLKFVGDEQYKRRAAVLSKEYVRLQAAYKNDYGICYWGD